MQRTLVAVVAVAAVMGLALRTRRRARMDVSSTTAVAPGAGKHGAPVATEGQALNEQALGGHRKESRAERKALRAQRAREARAAAKARRNLKGQLQRAQLCVSAPLLGRAVDPGASSVLVEGGHGVGGYDSATVTVGHRDNKEVAPAWKTPSPGRIASVSRNKLFKELRRERVRRVWGTAPTIVIDLGVTERLPPSAQERASVNVQIRELYVALMHATVPVELVVSSCTGPFRAELDRDSQGVWPVRFEADDVDRLFPCGAGAERRVVYLSPDSPNVLHEVRCGTVYVIGAIVDRTVKSGISLAHAGSLGLPTARLPIEEHFPQRHSSVLNINTVAEVLMAWLEYRDWKRAISIAVPPRCLLRPHARAQAREQRRQEVPADTAPGAVH